MKKENTMLNFKLEEKPGERPCYIHRDNGVEVIIYFAQPPLHKQGIWVMVSLPELKHPYMIFARPLEQFDRAALDDVAQNFELKR
jgi:hypothetical protein